MKLYYYHAPGGNFGDDLNRWLWPRVLPGFFDSDSTTLFVGIGSLLNASIPPATKLIFGTGIGYGATPVVDDTWKFYCVRGPLTATTLGIDPRLAATDGAALIATVYEKKASTYKRSFMPHHMSVIRAELAGIDLKAITESSGIHYLDPCADVEHTLDEIASSEVVLAEAMHAAIIADSLRVPWVAVSMFDHVNPLKWRDWLGSLSMDYVPVVATAVALSDIADQLQAAAKATPSLSVELNFRTKLQQLVAALDAVKSEYPRSGQADFPLPEENPQVAALEVEWFKDAFRIREELRAVIARGSKIMVLDDYALGMQAEELACESLPPEDENGQSCMPPTGGEQVVAAITRGEALGLDYVVFAWPCLWWLSEYRQLSEFVSQHCLLVHQSPRCKVFRCSPT